MVIALTVYLALSLLAALVIFPALILGSRADRWMNMKADTEYRRLGPGESLEV